MLTVACVLKGGGEYAPEHAEALFDGVQRWWPDELRFVCLTDDASFGFGGGIELRQLTRDLPGWWSKMELFAPEHDDLGSVLYLDLDTVVVGSLASLGAVTRMTMLRDFYHAERLASGMMLLPVKARQHTWGHWVADPKGIMDRYRRSGDGGFLNSLWSGIADAWQDVRPDQVLSYKAHVKTNHGIIPPDARVICFHGRPRPWSTILWGSRD